ncbi:MAG: hypothetical protein C0595_05790 [Marinilabiliales bacterium]|nr:MAG: hypothetical protein C0595_05790 [Marinilabiliales bacterium]
MRELSLILVFVASLLYQGTDSPHGDKLEISCSDCHTSEGWTVDRNTISFQHNQTGFELEGTHNQLDCKQCHSTLVFSDAQAGCISCHDDMHEQTVGFDCQRCHNSVDWIVTNITEIHNQGRFPLLGAHLTADCNSCHESASNLRFDPLGIECMDCHMPDYQATTNPNHVESNYSTNCTECHQMNAFSWTGANFTHALFPLTEGHANIDCNQCHKDPNDNSNISPECISCHQDDYNNASIINHVELDFSTVCTDCHTTAPGWSPAEFKIHDSQYFPIYSGEHGGEWNSCIECHETPGNYAQFTCISCHEHNKGEMDGEHDEVSGYIYESTACLECHPVGSEEGSFNHATSNFPLTGAHVDTECADCHTSGYSNTPDLCSDCHMAAFNESTNPNHVEIGLENTCDDCHTTDPGWIPAEFQIHDDFYPLTGAHTDNTVDCASCHNNDYVNTPNECVGCHLENYTESTNPNHVDLNFVQTCDDCHTTNPGWAPTTFDHTEFYPLTGAHTDPSVDCNSCHNGNYENTPNECVGCHLDNYNQASNPNHVDLNFSQTCDECHTTNPGWSPSTFDHSEFYALTGAHNTISNDCNACHNGNYENTPDQCVGCHLDNYNNSTNPNHVDAGFSQTCDECHTTNPGWSPATFVNHNDYWVITGAHINISSDCNACHNGDYQNTPNECVGCHLDDYNATNDPPHASAQFSTECLTCHTQNAWEPSTFDHDSQYFPIYSGEHNNEWDLCSECHTDPSNYSVFSCIDCHEHNQSDMNSEHEGVGGYVWDSNACYECHPNGEEGGDAPHLNKSNYKIN